MWESNGAGRIHFVRQLIVYLLLMRPMAVAMHICAIYGEVGMFVCTSKHANQSFAMYTRMLDGANGASGHTQEKTEHEKKAIVLNGMNICEQFMHHRMVKT